MKKKLVTILCVTTITASMLAGCGSKTAETTAPTETTAVTETAAATEAATTEAASETAAATEAEDDQAAADKVAALIDAIYVQERNENTDEQCKEAKEAWDALTDAQKELVEGEEADPDYFGRDTGDASKDDPRNQDEIGENELLVVSFGTSFNDSRVADIGGVEKAIQAAQTIASEKGLLQTKEVLDGYFPDKGEALTLHDVPLQFGQEKRYKDRWVTIIPCQ